MKETMLVKFENGLELRGTGEHPFYVENQGWVALKELKVGDVCFDREQNLVIVKGIVRDGKHVEVYNIEVEGCHTYYIGKDGLEVLVHNACTYSQAESAIREAEQIYAALLQMQRDGASDSAISTKYSEYLTARLRATKMYNEYVASIWFKGYASELNNMEKKLPVRLAEFETKSKPVEIAEYMQAQHEETKNSIADLQNYDNNMGKVEFGMAATSSVCITVGVGGLMIMTGGAAVALVPCAVPYLAAGGTGLLIYSVDSMASERRNNGQTMFQSGVGAVTDITGVSGIYGGWTNTDIMTGQNLGYTDSQAGSVFGNGIGQLLLQIAGPRLAKAGQDMVPPGSGFACFTEGTQIVVGMEYDEDGNFVCYVTANIEDIQVGDLVYSYDTATDQVTSHVVQSTLHRSSDHLRYIEVIDEYGVTQTFETTDAHPFWVANASSSGRYVIPEYIEEYDSQTGQMILLYHENTDGNEFGGYICAGDLRVGDICVGPNGELVTVISTYREVFAEGIAVYNLEVEGAHNYYVIANAEAFYNGASPVLVHNAVGELCGPDFIHYAKGREQQLAEKLGIQTEQIHKFKDKLLTLVRKDKEVVKGLKKAQTDNPDILLTKDGRIGLANPNSIRKSVDTGLSTSSPDIIKIIENLH